MNDNFDLLTFIHASQEKQLSYRRKRELQIFAWSNAILLTISGLLLSSYSQEDHNISNKSTSLRILITIFVIVLTSFSIKWQLYQRKMAAKHQKIISNAATKMGCFDGTNPIFPEKWKSWGDNYTTFQEIIKTPSKISATLFMALIAVISSWLDLMI